MFRLLPRSDKIVQMNGAELADGVVLHVEPAGSSPEDEKVASLPVAQNVAEEKDEEKADQEDEELNDFFDSL